MSTTQHLHDDPARTTPFGLARYAAEFMEAALAVDETMGQKAGHETIAPIPVMFLTGQAIELALKSFLVARGVSLLKIRLSYGHNLSRALRKAKALGLLDVIPIDADDTNAIELLDQLYATKQLQYIVTGSKIFPMFGPLEKAALKLIHGIGNEVGYPSPNLPNVY